MAPRHSGGTQEAPRQHPGGTQVDPGGTQEARDILETECVFSYAPAHKSDGGDHFRVDGSDVTITVYCACAQEFAGVRAKIAVQSIPNTEDTPPEPLQQRLFGEFCFQQLEDLLCAVACMCRDIPRKQVWHGHHQFWEADRVYRAYTQEFADAGGENRRR